MSYISSAYYSALNSFQGAVNVLEERLKVGQRVKDGRDLLQKVTDLTALEIVFGLAGVYSRTYGGYSSEFSGLPGGINGSLLVKARALAGALLTVGLLVHGGKTLVNRHILHHKVSVARNELKAGDQVALILRASDDPTHTFQEHFRAVNNFSKLSEEYKMVFHSLSSTEDLRECIESIVEKGALPKVIWIRGHGNQACMKLNEGEYLDHFTLKGDEFAKALNQVPSDGTIVLESCSTGAKWGIAEEIAGLVKGRKVFAPSEGLHFCGTTVESTNPLKVRFYSAPLWLDQFDITRVFQEEAGS